MTAKDTRKQSEGDSNKSVLQQTFSELDSLQNLANQEIATARENTKAKLDSLRDKQSQSERKLSALLEEESNKLRTTSPNLTTSAETAVLHYYGGELVYRRELAGLYVGLEQRIQKEIKEIDYGSYVPVLFTYYAHSGYWTSISERTNYLSLALVEKGSESKLFHSSVEEEERFTFAFSNKKIPILIAKLTLLSSSVTSIGSLHLPEGFRSFQLNDNLMLSSKSIAKDPKERSFSMAEFTSGDRIDSIFVENEDGLDEIEEGQERYESAVGWDEILQIICANTSNHRQAELGKRVVRIKNLHSLLTSLGKKDFSAIDHSLASALQKLTDAYNLEEALLKDMGAFDDPL